MTATIHRLPSRSRPRPVDDGSVMSAAELLAWHEERIVSGRAAFEAKLAEWEDGRRARQEAYFARKAAERDEISDAVDSETLSVKQAVKRVEDEWNDAFSKGAK